MYFTIDKILKELLVKMGEDTNHKYERLYPHALDFMDRFKTDVSREVKTVKLKITPQRTVRLPDDYIDYVKVGVVYGDGVRTLAFNSELSNIPDCKDTRPIYRPFNPHEPFYPFFGYGEYVLGYGNGGYRDSFSIDQQARVMRFGSEVNVGDIYLEYQSHEQESCSHTPVPFNAKRCLEEYVLWQYWLMRGNNYLNQARLHERYYYNELERLGRKENPFGIAEIYAGIYNNYTLSPKG